MSGAQLRETVKTYRQNGKDEVHDVIPLQMRRGIEPDQSLAKTMQVYEQIMNVSITGLATQNIDDLFLKAQSLEEQAKEEDDVYRKFQLENQFKLITFKGQHCKLIRAKLFDSYLSRSSPTISTVVLKLLQQLLKISTLPWFIKENIRITQKICRTSDDSSFYTYQQCIMLDLSKEGRQMSLCDFCSALTETPRMQKQENLERIQHIFETLSGSRHHKQLVQLYFSGHCTIKYSLNNSESFLAVLFSKFSTFFTDNMPNENAILAQLFLTLFEVDQSQLAFLPLEVLQFWLFSVQLKEQQPSKMTKQQQDKIDRFNNKLRKWRPNASKSRAKPREHQWLLTDLLTELKK